MKLELKTFGGELPKLAKQLLPANAGQTAQNCFLVRGDLRAFRAPLKDAALSDIAAKSLYRYDENSNENWVVTNTVRHYVESLIAGDAYERVYFTGEAQARFFANDNISVGGFDHTADYYKLGIPAPTTAPTVGSAGGGATYKGYVYAFVNSYGDEGPPSPVDSISDYNAGNVTLEDIEAAPSGRAIDKIYVYRTNSSGAGTAEFQFVLEATWFAITVDYVVGDFVIYGTDLYKCTTIHAAGAWNAGHFTAGDDVTDANLLSIYPKTNFDPPPDGLTNLISLANGCLAGFVGNELYFSEPYYPHAWPTDYTIGFDADIIGLGVEKSTVTVVTAGQPYRVYGSHPSAMVKDKISRDYPGLFIRGVISANGGTSFITRQGLISVGDTISNITASILDPKDLADYAPNTLSLYFYENKYFGFDSVGKQGFIIDLVNGQFIPLSIYAYAGFVTKEGEFYIVADDLALVDENDPPANMPLCVKLWEGDTVNYLQYTWRSKEYITPIDTNFSIARMIVDQSFYDAVAALIDLATLNATLFASPLQGALGIDGPLGGLNELGGDALYTIGSISMSQYVTFRLYANDTLIKTKTVNETDTKFRLPADSLANRFEIEITGHIPVKAVIIATSPSEL